MHGIPCSVVFIVLVAIHAVVLVLVTVSINCHLKLVRYSSSLSPSFLSQPTTRLALICTLLLVCTCKSNLAFLEVIPFIPAVSPAWQAPYFAPISDIIQIIKGNVITVIPLLLCQGMIPRPLLSFFFISIIGPTYSATQPVFVF